MQINVKDTQIMNQIDSEFSLLPFDLKVKLLKDIISSTIDYTDHPIEADFWCDLADEIEYLSIKHNI